MPNELRDPHDPVILGEHVPSPEGHGGVSMPIGQSNPDFDPHEPVLPEGMKHEAGRSPTHRSNADTPKRSRSRCSREAEKDIADSTAKAEIAKGRVSRRP